MAEKKSKDYLNPMREDLAFIGEHILDQEKKDLIEDADVSDSTFRSYVGGHIPTKLIGEGLINRGMKILNARGIYKNV